MKTGRPSSTSELRLDLSAVGPNATPPSSQAGGASSSAQLPDGSAAGPTTTTAALQGASPVSPPSTGVPLDPQLLSVSDRKKVMYIMLLLKVITSYDSGAYGAVLGINDGIQQDLGMSVVEEGALGSAPFVGNTIGCAVASVLFLYYPARHVLILGMAMHFTCTILFAMSSTFIVALLARTLIGFTLSFVVVYSVVWTDLFAPKANATTWLGMMNAGVPLGMLAGFVMGGAVTPAFDLSWRMTFLFKALVLLPVLIALSRTSPSHINDPAVTCAIDKRKTNGEPLPHQHSLGGPRSHKQAAGGAKKPPSVCGNVVHNTCTLLRNELFVCAVMGLVVLYFVVTAMQVFITQYLRQKPFEASMNTIVFGFGLSSVTAPVSGVICGGMILDRLGGYQTNLRRAAIFGATCGTLASWFALIACYMETLPTFLAALWCMLFVGAANVPVGTGILMASVSPEMRSTASGYAAVTFNMLGYFLGPIVCGYLADVTGSLRVAFHIVLMSSGLGCIPMGLTIIYAHRAKPELDDDGELSRPPSTGNPVEDIAQVTVLAGSFAVSVPNTPQLRSLQATPQRLNGPSFESAFDRTPSSRSLGSNR